MKEESVIKLSLNFPEYKGIGNEGLLLIYFLLDNHQPSNEIAIDRRYAGSFSVSFSILLFSIKIRTTITTKLRVIETPILFCFWLEIEKFENRVSLF